MCRGLFGRRVSVPPRLCQDIGLAAGAPGRSSARDTADSNHPGGQGPAGVPEALLPGGVRHPQRLSGQTGLCTVSALGPALLPDAPSLELDQTVSAARGKQTGSLPRSPAPGGQQGVAPGLPQAKPLAGFWRALRGEVATAWPRSSMWFRDRSLPHFGGGQGRPAWLSAGRAGPGVK